MVHQDVEINDKYKDEYKDECKDIDVGAAYLSREECLPHPNIFLHLVNLKTRGYSLQKQVQEDGACLIIVSVLVY